MFSSDDVWLAIVFIVSALFAWFLSKLDNHESSWLWVFAVLVVAIMLWGFHVLMHSLPPSH